VAISIHVEPETGMAIVTCSGVLRVDDAKEGAAALWKSPGWSGTSAVWDFREAQFDMTPSDPRELARFILHNQPAKAPERIAFVASRDVDFGMARMFEAFREDPRTAFQVFRDYEEALSWARSAEPNSA
jgi:hypothetical protein